MMRAFAAVLAAASLFVTSGCGRHVTCGNGTRQVGDQCVDSGVSSDPLIGVWAVTGANGFYADKACEFFENGEWNNSCQIVSGTPTTWARIYENRYVLGVAPSLWEGPCDVQTIFAADNNSVAVTSRCGRTTVQAGNLVRIQ